MTPSSDERRRPQLLRRLPPNIWAIVVLAVIGIVVYLAVDHWPHVLAALPYVGILAVAGAHLFGHGSHGGHSGHSGGAGAGASSGHDGAGHAARSSSGSAAGDSGEGR